MKFRPPYIKERAAQIKSEKLLQRCNMKNKRTKFKALLISTAVLATSCLIGMSAACSSSSSSSKDDDKETTTKVDEQVIKNGNFEFYKDNKGLYFISNADNWSSGTSGNSSASMSGIINTRKDRWEYATDPELPAKLKKNNDLDSKDDKKVDYNGALADDAFFKNPHVATEEDRTITADDYIDNPFTHEYSYDSEGNVKNTNGETVNTYEKDGEYYLDEACTVPFETSVLMIHNYRSQSDFKGTESYFNSSTTVALEAGTACEISLWVKTSDLYYDGTENKRTPVTCDHGAYIKVESSVGSNSVSEPFMIRNINTEQLNAGKDTVENNGWIKYTVFVEASNFADTSVTLTLGLGNDSVYTVEGYAFFDDITFTKYLSNSDMSSKPEFDANIRQEDDGDKKANTCFPLKTDADFEFRVDEETGKTEEFGEVTTWTDSHFSDDKYFLINFASTTQNTAIDLTEGGVSAGLTVEETTNGANYVCTNLSDFARSGSVALLDNGANTAIVPNKLGDGIKVSDDFVRTLSITEDFTFTDATFDSSNKLNKTLTDALKTAASLPDADNNTSALVILSAYGASYEAQISNGRFHLSGNKDEYVLISFWLKTSDMKGKTAATITAFTEDDKNNKSSFNVDTTTVSTVTIEDKEDVYNGWVRCFVRVSNTSDKPQTFKIKVNFGPTTIKGTEDTSYRSGWMALANLAVIDNIDETVYNYSSGASRAATLSFEEKTADATHNFDEEKSSSRNDIKKSLALPSSYTGVNGASSNVKPAEILTDYDKPNDNVYAGLLNKNYIDNYKELLEDGNSWFSALSAVLSFNSSTEAGEIWKKIAGGDSVVQPLIIVNAVRQFNEEMKIYNYGYYGSTTTISANSYSSVSVKVKASAGSIASVYLVEDNAEHNVLNYATPAYTFWYDDNGNVLKGKPEDDWTTAQKKANVAYTLRSDGLYEKDGELYANFYNLATFIDVNYYEAEEMGRTGFYDAVNNEILSVEKAVKAKNGVKFVDAIKENGYLYSNSDKTAYASHFLVASGEQNSKIYMYRGGLGSDATYYYMEKGVANKSKIVHPFDTSVAALRYDMSNAETPYSFTIDTTTPEGAKYADKWVTVTFNIHSGSEAKAYRLELWSGKRDEASSYSSTDTSYVMFDYDSVSLDETTYNDWLNEYKNEIINDYREKITTQLDENDDNIAKLEQLAGADNRSDVYDNYNATYFTFSLYDSSAFIPFNKGTAEANQTGYSYNYSDNEENLALFTVEDSKNYSMTAFVDYTVIDKDVDIIGAPTVDDDDNNNNDTNTSSSGDTNAWLLAASIALVAAIFVAMIALFLKQYFSKHRRKNTAAKNSYNFKKNKRYVKKYVKANGEAPEISDGEVDKSLLTDAEEPAAEEEITEETSEKVAEEKVAEEGQNTTADDAETPAEDTSSDKAEEIGDKPEEDKSTDNSQDDKPEGDNPNE